MALVDFHQLVLLYKLSLCDVGTLSDHPHPSEMPAPTHMGPPLASVANTRLYSIPTYLRPEPRSLTRKPIIPTNPSTPQAKGTSAVLKQEPYTGLATKYDSDDYRQFIRQDFEHHRVFVGMEDFMTTVLHVPDDWRTQWGPAIQEIKVNQTFMDHHGSYTKHCDTPGSKESAFYAPLVNMVNAILDITSKSPLEYIRPNTPQRYVRNDPAKIFCGILNEAHLSPDIVAVHKNLVRVPKKGKGKKPPRKKDNLPPKPSEVERPPLEKDEAENPLLDQDDDDIERPRLKKANLTWAQPLQVLEVKPFDSSIVDGSRMPRLMRNGKPAEISPNVL